MAITPKDLFTSLQAGDLLMIPIKLPVSGEEIIAFSAVLRTDGDKLYLSKGSEHRASAEFDSCCNPFRWDDGKGALVDKDGDVPRWYTVNIQLERGGAEQVAAAYIKVPRLDQCRYQITDEDFKDFLNKDSGSTILGGIIQNGEAGSPASQLLLALDVMGVVYTREQMIGLSYFAELLVAKHQVSTLIIAMPGGSDDDVSVSEKHPLTH